jgi:hypothetical protein
MYGFMRSYPNKLPYLCGEGDPLGTASWVCMPQSEYGRLNRCERSEVEEAFFTLEFMVDSIPESALLSVSAVNRYRLFINGTSCAFGPRKGDQYNQYYDNVDIGSLLHIGRNLIAVYVVSATAKALQIGRGQVLSATSIYSALDAIALIVNAKIGNVDISTGVAPWRVRMDTSKRHHFYEPCDLHGSFEIADLRAYPSGWNTDASISSDWAQVEIMFKAGVNYYGQIRALPLMPRPFAVMEESTRKFVRQIQPSSDPSFSFDDAGCATIPVHTKASVILDAGEHMTGFVSTPYFGANAVVRYTYAESFLLRHAPAGYMYGYPLEDEKGPLYKFHRDDENGEIIGAWDEITTADAGVFEPFWFRTFRFIRIDVETTDSSLEIRIPSIRRTGYPLKVESHVESSDPSVRWLWDTSLRTLKNCMHETFEDGPYYEQLQYVMDSKLQMDYVYAISSETDFPAATIWDFHCSLRPDGMLSCSYPSNEVQIIPGFSLQFIWMLERYYHHTADIRMVRFYRPTMDAILAYFDRHLNVDGLCEGLGYWEFADWSGSWNSSHGRPNAIYHGPSAIFNLMYAYSLQLAARLNRETDRAGIAGEYENRARSIINAVKKTCWVETRGMLCEAPGFMEYSQHSQLLADLTGLLVDDEAKRALQNSFAEDVIECSLPWRFYLFRALEHHGMYDQMRERLDEFVHLKDYNLTTLPEWSFDGPRSDCHAWSAAPLYEMTATVLGVRAEGDGWKRISICPHALGYNDFCGEVITPRGMVRVDWKIVGSEMLLEIDTPWETVVSLPDGRKRLVTAGNYCFKSNVP